MGIQPDVSYLWLDYTPPRFPLSFYHGRPGPEVFAEEAPVRTYEDASGGPVELWLASDAATTLDLQVYWLVFRFGSWTVLAPVQDLSDARDVARGLHGRETPDGFVVVRATPPLGLSNEPGEGRGPELTVGDRAPAPNLVGADRRSRWIILRPGRGTCKEEYGSSYAHLCLRGEAGGGTVAAHIYGDRRFIRAVYRGLEARGVHVLG